MKEKVFRGFLESRLVGEKAKNLKALLALELSYLAVAPVIAS